ncbi:hypothetical protein ASG01_12580 [Chryseobacterium sp. Leaf180]|uniref:DUF3575 domain-containing protein n=1 Tax=Chryseobacterium sp. Leaf180 TaxID=1736289 RepID=UPI0006F44FBB|nr:DUF3575 domain-containing protein [Chryseobacterium sp. Leaf180]KQR91836.1 hypothetical protein ASG01_12580 [Chryseobacterium sp. Leaf180]
MYKTLLLTAITFSGIATAQTRIKANAVFLPVGMLNMAVEKPVSPKISIQGEAFISPWKSFDGKHLEVGMGTVEGRYYFREMMKGWFVGVYASAAAFNLQKWNYLNAITVTDEFGNPELRADGSVRVTELYQKGYAFIAGISGGYHITFSEKWGMDVFAGIGTVQSVYKGYYKDNDQRYDKADQFNKSGEFLPTRGGLMITYTLAKADKVSN